MSKNQKSGVSKNTAKTAKRLLKYVTGMYKVQFVIVFGYEAVAGCEVGDKVEVGKREKLSAAGFLCEPGEILDTKYGDVRFVRQ